MECEQCGGLVTWRGPMSALTHTECNSCGGRNCQRAEPIADEYGNPEDGSTFLNCSFPDCGCDGARLCQAESGANSAAAEWNLERRKTPNVKWATPDDAA